MELVEVKKEEYNKITESFNCKNFFQTSNMGDILEKRGKKVYYLALKQDNKYVASAMLSENYTFLKKKEFICLKGFLIDYNNNKLVKEFSDCLLKFVKEHNGFKLKIDPYIIKEQRDIDGNIVEGGKNNLDVIKNLESIGYKKSKIDTQVRFNFCLDLDASEDEIFSNFKATTRNIISKSIREGVEVFNLSYEELPNFKKVTEYTCNKRGFADKSIGYYQSMFNAFKDEVTFKMARLNVQKYKDYLNSTKEDYLNKLEKIKNNNKKKDNYLFEVGNIDKKLEKIANIKDDYIDLAASMFMLYGDETIYLFSGSYDEYAEFGGQYLIQWEIIKYGIANKYKRHNFFGIIDFQDKKSKDYGIYLFKRGFNGYVEELLGEYYIYINGPVAFLDRVKNKVRGR